MNMQWIRLWVDMPTDPKFKTIARKADRPIALVIAVYLHLMTSAANATERGRTQVNEEDLASALDVGEDDITAVLLAMQGRVLEGDLLTGWEKRQPIREDGSAERAKAWREKQKTERNRTQPNAEQTQKNARGEEIRGEEIEEKDNLSVPSTSSYSEETLVSTIEQHASSDALPTERKKSSRKSRIDPALLLADDWIADAKRINPHCVPAKLFPAFVDHHHSRGNTMSDWRAAWRTWIRNDLKFSSAPARSSPAQSDWSPPRHRRI